MSIARSSGTVSGIIDSDHAEYGHREIDKKIEYKENSELTRAVDRWRSYASTRDSAEIRPLGYCSAKYVGLGDFGGELDDNFDFSVLSKVIRAPRKSKIFTKQDDEIHVNVDSFIDTNGHKDIEVTASIRDQNIDFFSRTGVSAPSEEAVMSEEMFYKLETPPGVDSVVVCGSSRIEVGTEYGATLVLEHDFKLPLVTCNAVVRQQKNICEIYVYDILRHETFSTELLPFRARLRMMQEMSFLKNNEIRKCYGNNHVCSNFVFFFAGVSCCGPGMDIDYRQFNFFIRSSFLRMRSKENFFFFTGYSKVDVIIRDKVLFLERRRYNSGDSGCLIELGKFDFRNCRLQGLLYDGDLLLLMTRVSRVGSTYTTIRYGFSQLRLLKEADFMALMIKGLFDNVVYQCTRIILSQRKEIEILSAELKLHRDDKRDRDKRRAKNEEQLKKRKELRELYYGKDAPYHTSAI